MYGMGRVKRESCSNPIIFAYNRYLRLEAETIILFFNSKKTSSVTLKFFLVDAHVVLSPLLLTLKNFTNYPGSYIVKLNKF